MESLAGYSHTGHASCSFFLPSLWLSWLGDGLANPTLLFHPTQLCVFPLELLANSKHTHARFSFDTAGTFIFVSVFALCKVSFVDLVTPTGFRILHS